MAEKRQVRSSDEGAPLLGTSRPRSPTTRHHHGIKAVIDKDASS